ncbi:MAG: FAD-dependent oxidoreductase [Phycisphaerae bacterium]
MKPAQTIQEPARSVPVCHTADVCVIGGSATGVFAAIAAARLGKSVALVENEGMFGGTATASMVNVWHSQFDEPGEKKIFAGLVEETMGQLVAAGGAVDRAHNRHWQWAFHPHRLAMLLDEMVGEQAAVRPFLHARFVAVAGGQAGRPEAAIIEDKSGRRAIRAKVFIDATGDADLVDRAGLETWQPDHIQPPTTTFLSTGVETSHFRDGMSLRNAVFNQSHEGALKPGFLWHAPVPGLDVEQILMVAGTRVHGADCSDADQLTAAEIEGRRQVRRILELAHKHRPYGQAMHLVALPGRIGIRDSRRIVAGHRLSQQEVLTGVRFEDAVVNGSYRVDIHSQDGEGLIFRYLNGEEVTCYADGSKEVGRWAPQGEATATFYQVPYRCLIPAGSENILAAGRCIDTDEGAFGAYRVMVNCGQSGQAAGVAAALAAETDGAVGEVDTGQLRDRLASQGAIVL